MPKSFTFAKALFLIAAFIMTTALVKAQRTWVKGNNVSCYYYIQPELNFNWSGSCKDNYCNGFGTLNVYYNNELFLRYIGNIQNGRNDGYGVLYAGNGIKNYEGYWKNGRRSGYGTFYDESGYIKFKGIFADDELSNLSLLNIAAKALTELVVDKIFDGGTNIRYRIVKAVSDQNNDLEEIRVKMMFNGNIITENYYEGTLVINLKDFKVDFVNYNDNFEFYATISISAKVLQEMEKILSDD